MARIDHEMRRRDTAARLALDYTGQSSELKPEAMRPTRSKKLLSLLVLLSACASQPVTPENGGRMSAAVAACRADLAAQVIDTGRRLDAESIRVVNWNIQKGADPQWLADLRQIDAAPDLLLLQEASPELDNWQTLAPDHYHSFAEGFRRFGLQTGVITVSTARPLAECDLVVREPWLRSRKAMLVTRYGLDEVDETLLVINIHAINFSFGMRALREQFDEAEAVIAAHTGPVLFSGDFNTWRGARKNLLEETVSRLGMAPLDFDADYRKRFRGWALDHIYIRGLEAIAATTHDLNSSDHNPMTVELRVAAARTRDRLAP